MIADRTRLDRQAADPLDTKLRRLIDGEARALRQWTRGSCDPAFLAGFVIDQHGRCRGRESCTKYRDVAVLRFQRLEHGGGQFVAGEHIARRNKSLLRLPRLTKAVPLDCKFGFDALPVFAGAYLLEQCFGFAQFNCASCPAEAGPRPNSSPACFASASAFVSSS